MIKQFWVNLPVKDVKKSMVFFEKMGFEFNTQYGNTESSACMLVGDNHIAVMLFEEPLFTNFTNSEVCNTAKSAEVLLSIDAQSKEEVDAMAQKAVEAGGACSHVPSDMKGWMYGCVFSDLDGHRWNLLYMDMSKMPMG